MSGESTGAIKIHQLFKEAPHLASDRLVPGCGYLTWNELKSLGTALDRAEAEKAELQEKLAQREYDCRAELAAIDAANTLRAELESTRDELEATRTRESKLETSIAEIGQRSHVLETRRNELHSKLEQEMLECDALRAALDRAEAEKADSNMVARGWEGKVQIEQRKNEALRAELAAVRSVLIRVDEWWTSLPPGLRQDIEGSGAVPGCIAAVLTALQSHRRTEGAPTADEPEHD